MSPLMVCVIAVVTVASLLYVTCVQRVQRQRARAGECGRGELRAVKIVADACYPGGLVHTAIIRSDDGRRINSTEVPEWLLDNHVYSPPARRSGARSVNLRGTGQERRHAADKIRHGGYVFELAAPVRVRWTCQAPSVVHWAVDGEGIDHPGNPGAHGKPRARGGI